MHFILDPMHVGGEQSDPVPWILVGITPGMGQFLEIILEDTNYNQSHERAL
jgi:hypothetical protein